LVSQAILEARPIFVAMIATMSAVDSYLTFLEAHRQAIIRARGRSSPCYATVSCSSRAAVFTMIGKWASWGAYPVRPQERMFDHLRELSLSYYDKTPWDG
jgi:hypothetical protein